MEDLVKVFYGDGRMNFVDARNVVVGYEYDRNCCELFGWLAVPEPRWPTEAEADRSHTEVEAEQSDTHELPGYYFDTDYFARIPRPKEYPEGRAYDDGDGLIAFRMLHKSSPAMYLCLYNLHNGYYSHGFSFGGPGEFAGKICKGEL